ncbi:MAG: manno-octulosonate cytidylyltransferase [Pseudomonadota bacterium]
MSTAIVIPARYASTRYPGKPLAVLKGATGIEKTLIQRTWEAAMEGADGLPVYVATDDERIKDASEGFGAHVIMTDPAARNGTERCAGALSQIDAEVIVNVQGDAPLTPPSFVRAMIKAMNDAATQVATPVLRCDAETLANFREDRAHGRVGGTTAVFGAAMNALYFSKEVVPFVDGNPDPVPVFHHVGLYAYRRAALQAYAALEPGPLETLEGLEQLRFLENGLPVTCVEVQAQGRVFWELNNPIDVDRIQSVYAREGIL